MFALAERRCLRCGPPMPARQPPGSECRRGLGLRSRRGRDVGRQSPPAVPLLGGSVRLLEVEAGARDGRARWPPSPAVQGTPRVVLHAPGRFRAVVRGCRSRQLRRWRARRHRCLLLQPRQGWRAGPQLLRQRRSRWGPRKTARGSSSIGTEGRCRWTRMRGIPARPPCRRSWRGRGSRWDGHSTQRAILVRLPLRSEARRPRTPEQRGQVHRAMARLHWEEHWAPGPGPTVQVPGSPRQRRRLCPPPRHLPARGPMPPSHVRC